MAEDVKKNLYQKSNGVMEYTDADAVDLYNKVKPVAEYVGWTGNFPQDGVREFYEMYVEQDNSTEFYQFVLDADNKPYIAWKCRDSRWYYDFPGLFGPFNERKGVSKSFNDMVQGIRKGNSITKNPPYYGSERDLRAGNLDKDYPNEWDVRTDAGRVHVNFVREQNGIFFYRINTTLTIKERNPTLQMDMSWDSKTADFVIEMFLASGSYRVDTIPFPRIGRERNFKQLAEQNIPNMINDLIRRW